MEIRDDMRGIIPPNSVEAEISVLGAMLQDSIAVQRATEQLQSDDFYQAILPMLIVNQGTMICMSTPFGKRGHFFNEWQNGGSDWQRIQVEATQCPRMTVEELERQKRAMGDMFFRQEFMCEFVDNILQTFSHDSIERAFTDEIEPLEV